MKSRDEHMELIRLYLSGEAAKEDVTALESLMLEDDQLRADFLAYARVDAALPAMVGERPELTLFETKPSKVHRWLLWAPAAALILISTMLGVMLMQEKGENAQAADALATLPAESQVVARFGTLNDCQWINSSANIHSGDPITMGQRIELSTGNAEIIFSSGARLNLVGPSIIETRSNNSSFLTLGEAHVTAHTEESKGFTLETPYSTFIDISTAFTATVSPDGLSRLEVSEGEVDAILEKGGKRTRFSAGQTLYVEPGKNKILTRIEPGDGSKAFRFATIEPPSNSDYADLSAGHATISTLSLPINPSGSADALLDGKGQSSQDAPKESAFFVRQPGYKALLLDLGTDITITKINTYSWHQNEKVKEHRERAQQRYTLYGYAGDTLPDLTGLPDMSAWTRITRVNSDQFFKVNERLDRPAQQACSITAASGNLGRYRYLLWHTKGSTFFGEFDVYGAP